MKRIVYLTFYFTPDLCAGSFRNSPLAKELALQAKEKNAKVDVYTTLPNRYSTFSAAASEFEEIDNLRIFRIALPPHKSGMFDQVVSFWKYYTEVIRLNKGEKADLVFASSSRLFTAFLGYKLSNLLSSLLYLDIRDIFVDTMNDVLKSKFLKTIILPFLKLVEKRTFNRASHINLISGGFKEYFQRFDNPFFSYYSNGIDDVFLEFDSLELGKNENPKKQIVYAGNLGEGQGLHKIVPEAAKMLEKDFEFLIIGDGGTKKHLKSELTRLNVKNVVLQDPVNRKELQRIYNNADFLFLHLNDYPAFKKVLPSKIFELATFKKPIIAGVGGYSAQFIKENVSYSFVFEPCNIDQLVNYLSNYKEVEVLPRTEFLEKFSRKRINAEMASSILSYI